MNRTLRALVADDEPLARARLTRLLEREDGIDVVASCADGAQALQAIRELRPDVVFLDVRMPGMDGLEATAEYYNASLTWRGELPVVNGKRLEPAQRRGIVETVERAETADHAGMTA